MEFSINNCPLPLPRWIRAPCSELLIGSTQGEPYIFFQKAQRPWPVSSFPWLPGSQGGVVFLPLYKQVNGGPGTIPRSHLGGIQWQTPTRGNVSCFLDRFL